MQAPLSGIKVLDLSTFVAAPVCCRLLADLGAEVIKVERPDGDAWRTTGKNYRPERFNDQENPVFDIYNTGKKHIALNLKTEAGEEIFFKLLEQADVFVTNTRFNTPESRNANKEAYYKIFQQAFSSQPISYWLKKSKGIGSSSGADQPFQRRGRRRTSLGKRIS